MRLISNFPFISDVSGPGSATIRGLYSFAHDGDGAVVIEWTALVAGIVIMATALVFAIYRDGVAPVTAQIETTMTSSDLAVSANTVDMGFLDN